MKKTVTMVLAALMLMSLLSGCADDKTASTAVSSADAAVSESSENFTDEMKIPYATDLSAADGADSVERDGDHQDSPYFAHPDVYDMFKDQVKASKIRTAIIEISSRLNRC
jgi:hypothetical protein